MSDALPTARPVRVRLAPSPTGALHVGTARAGLLNYLFAKRHGGSFILRIEDTDAERSQAIYTANILQGLQALGLSWDEGPCPTGEGELGEFGPYCQSQRKARYQAVAHQLLAEGKAYRDFITEAEIAQRRDEAQRLNQPFVYRSQALPPEAEAEKLAAGEPYSLRFAVPATATTLTFTDSLRGEVSVEASTVSDFVILKSDGMASYNFAVVVDDTDMAITHVIRGEDHIPNTPRQVLLYEALGKPLPLFTHLSMILAPDRSKLSKRFGATAVSDYIYEQGFLPEAMVNFLALLGWSHPEAKELLTLDELVASFDLSRLSTSGAVFDRTKLEWMNGQYIRQLSLEELDKRCQPFWHALQAEPNRYTPAQRHALLALVQESLVTLKDIDEQTATFFGDALTTPADAELQASVLATPEGQQVLQQALTALHQLDDTTPETCHAWLKELSTALKPLKAKQVFWPLRAALTGRVQGADLSGTLNLLGKQRIALRLQQACVSQVSL